MWIIGAALCLALLTYLGYVHFKKRALWPLITGVAATGKPTAQTTASSKHNSTGIRSPIDHGNKRRSESSNLSPTVDSFLRHRNPSRMSEISYISPNSTYGYMPKTNIFAQKNKPIELKKEFTVKLSPFPPLSRSILSPMGSIGSPNETIGANRSLLNDSQPKPIPNGLPERAVSMPRVSSKRPMTSSDDDEELYLKKSKNLMDTIELDDEDIFEDEIEIVNEPLFSKKATKRSTLSLDNEMMNSPQKRVKNNEILSSYSSTVSHSRNLLNKRKYSPEDTSANTKVKKRTYIEELELLASDMSPYYKNIYNSKPDLILPKTTSVSETNLTSANLNSNSQLKDSPQLEPMRLETDNSKLNDFMDHIDEDDSQDIILETDLEEEETTNHDKERFYPIPSHVFSMTDHEYDKKKSKNRLDQFLAAVQQASDANESKLTQPKKATQDFQNSNSITTTSSSAIFSLDASNKTSFAEVSNGSSEINAPKPIAPLTTTIVLSDGNLSDGIQNGEKAPKPILKLPSAFTLPTSTVSSLANSISNTPASDLTSINNTVKLSSAITNLPNSIGGLNSNISISKASNISANKAESTLLNSSTNPLLPISSSSTPFVFGSTNPTTNLQAATFTIPPVSKVEAPASKPAVQMAPISLNPPISISPFVSPKPLNSTSSILTTLASNGIQSANTQFPSVPSFNAQPSKPLSFAGDSANKPAPLAKTPMFNFGQTQPSIAPPKPSFDFSQIKSTAFNSTLPSLSTSSTEPTILPTLNMNGSANNIFANNLSMSNANNGIKPSLVPMPKSTLPTPAASGFNFSTPAPTFNSNMFAFNAPPATQNTSSNKSENMFNFNAAPPSMNSKPNISMPTKSGFNFSAVPSLPSSSGFNFGSQAAPSSTPSLSFPITASAPSALPSLNSNSTPFTFGASSATPFQFKSK